MMTEVNGGRTSFKLFGTVILKEEKKHGGAREDEETTETAAPSPAPATETVEEAAARAAAAAALPCPRCMSMETKFCYFNNYNVNQPRHFCKACHRYWTAGGTLRNVPVGAGRRRGRLSTFRGGAAAVAAAAAVGAGVLEYASAAECLGGQQRWLLRTETPMARSDRGFGAGLR